VGLLLLIKVLKTSLHVFDHYEGLFDDVVDRGPSINNEALDQSVNRLNWRGSALTQIELLVGVARCLLSYDIRHKIGIL
jgi:hypothetical protein